MKIKVRNLKPEEEKSHLEMLNLCYGRWGSKERWRKRYHQSEFDITKNVLVVEESGKWIGGVTTWFREAFLRNNKKIKLYIAGDAYVHPNHRGKGVYSISMRKSMELAQRKGATLGLGFISIYAIPFVALPRYGFVDIFYPQTKIFVLKPERFIHYVSRLLQLANFPKKLEGIKIQLAISLNTPQRQTIGRVFEVKKRKLCELTDESAPQIAHRKTDLQVTADMNALLKILFVFYLKKRSLLIILLKAFLQRRLKLGLSISFLKKILVG